VYRYFEGLAHLMADHTALDWRPLLPRIAMPSLVLVGQKSQIFPWEGVAAVVGAIQLEVQLTRRC
jgi:pimeloyl-ACP methyl ester carboxylesterase